MKYLKITRVRSTNRALYAHRHTVKALGLHRIGQTVYKKDTPQVRGMVDSVFYLVTCESVNEAPPKVVKEKKSGYKVVKATKS